jgi:hypothetical protein
MFLIMRSRSVTDALAPVQAEYTKREWLSSKQQAELEKEQKELQRQVEAINKFVSSRIIWTSYTQDISARLPADATLTMFQGLCELETTGKKDGVVKPKKAFTIRATAPIAEDRSTPKEVDLFLTALRSDPLLKRDFPIVELADIKWFQPNVTAQPNALFTVICLPKGTNAPAKPPDDHDADKAGKK